MFEHESRTLRDDIEFLRGLTEEQSECAPDELKEKLLGIESDINDLLLNLPVDAVDDAEEREYQFPDEFEDNAELEDEVVECEALIEEAQALILEVRSRYMPESSVSPAPKHRDFADIPPAWLPKPKYAKKEGINWELVTVAGFLLLFLIMIIIGD